MPIRHDLNNNNRKSPTVMAPMPVMNPSMLQGNTTVVKIESIPMDYEDESTSQSYTSSNLDMSTSSSSKQHLNKSLSGDSRSVRPAPTLATGRKSKDTQVGFVFSFFRFFFDD